MLLSSKTFACLWPRRRSSLHFTLSSLTDIQSKEKKRKEGGRREAGRERWERGGRRGGREGGFSYKL
jgi:hypothetical protein